MLRVRLLVLACGAALGLPGLADAKDCPRAGASVHARGPDRPGCPSEAKPKPEDRPALKAGERPGFIDIGGGTELRVGGRVRVEMDHRR
jgi:hypothetical protein